MGRYLTTTGTARVTDRFVSTTYSAVANDRIYCIAGGFTITLPASPIDGDVIQIIDVTSIFASSNVTVARNGQLINSSATNLTLDVAGAAVTLVFSGATYGWIITGS